MTALLARAGDGDLAERALPRLRQVAIALAGTGIVWYGADTLLPKGAPAGIILDGLVFGSVAFAEGEVEDPLRSRREGEMSRNDPVSVPDDLLDARADVVEGDPERGERLGRDLLRLPQHAEEEVLGPDVAVAELASLVRCQDDGSPPLIAEPLEHRVRA